MVPSRKPVAPVLVEFAQQLLTEHPAEAARSFQPLVALFDEVLDDFATPVLSAEIAGRLDATLARSADVGVDRSSEGGS